MRTKILLMLALVASLVFMCSKDSDTPTDPTDGPGNGGGETTTTSFAMTKHLVTTELPNYVTILMQITDLSGKGVDFLTSDRFQIEEEGQRLDAGAASAFILKKSNMNYTIRTKILIDNDAGTNLDVLKKGALAIVQGMDVQQELAVYTISDKLEMVQDYTSDANTLTGAINGIAESSDTSNLYAGIMEAKRDRDEYDLAGVIQHTYVLLTDSNDEVGSISQDAIGPLTSRISIYTVGYGDVDADKLDDIGVVYFGAADEAEMITAAQGAQTEVLKYANSIYRLSYRSSLRGGSGHSLVVTISGNTNTENSAKLEDSFNSSPFVDVDDGLYVNWSYSNPEGVDLVLVRTGSDRTVRVLSMGGTKEAKFSLQIDNPNVVSGNFGAGGMLVLTAKGAVGDSTSVKISDTANGTSKEITVKIVDFQLGSVLFEIFENYTGSISNMANNPPDNPTSSSELESWEIPTDVNDTYATRIRGYLHPPTTGEYIFWIASDDQSQLFLSTDGDPANRVKICEVTSWTNSREWGKEANQKSDPIQLEAGKHYYMETVHVEGSGGDNLAVAWQIDGSTREIITGDYLSFWLGD